MRLRLRNGAPCSPVQAYQLALVHGHRQHRYGFAREQADQRLDDGTERREYVHTPRGKSSVPRYRSGCHGSDYRPAAVSCAVHRGAADIWHNLFHHAQDRSHV